MVDMAFVSNSSYFNERDGNSLSRERGGGGENRKKNYNLLANYGCLLVDCL